MPPTANLSNVTRTGNNPVTRAYDAKIDDVSQSERSLVARINTAGIDRFKTVIDPKGGRFDNYRKNPVVLWEHGKDPRHFTDPIGRNLWIRSSGGERPTEILAKTKFLDDDFSRQRYEWYRDGVLNAFSVNILPNEGRCGPPTKDEIRARPELGQEWENAKGEWRGVIMYREWDLAEYSGTSVPGNADALADRAAKLSDLVTRGLLWVPDEVRDILGRTTTDSMGGLTGGGATVAPEEPETAKRYITHDKESGKWIVHAESGKVLGTHDSEESAKKQLAAIEAHKHADRAAPWIDEDAGIFMVRDLDGANVLATTDQGLARDALEAMTQPRRVFEALHFELINVIRQDQEQRRRANEEFKGDIQAMLDLMVYGRV